MSLTKHEPSGMKRNENAWDSITAGLAAAVTSGTSGAKVTENHPLVFLNGKDNPILQLHEILRLSEKSCEVHQVELATVMEADGNPNDTQQDRTNNERNSTLVVIQTQMTDLSTSTQAANGLKLQDKGTHLQDPNDKDKVVVYANNVSSEVHEAVKTVSDVAESQQRGTDLDVVNQSEVEDSTLGKRPRNPEEICTQGSGKKTKKSVSVAGQPGSADTSHEERKGYSQAMPAKALDHHHQKPEWLKPHNVSVSLPPGLEKLKRVFTALNTASGYLQKQSIKSLWPNVKQALRQLSGPEAEEITLEDVQHLALLFPKLLWVTKVSGEAEGTSFNIGLRNQADNKEIEQTDASIADGSADVLASSTQTKVSDTEIKHEVERRQKQFELALGHLPFQVAGCVPGSDDEHGSNDQVQSIHHWHDNQQSLGLPILALPTQSLVLTPPPLLTQSLQGGFTGTSSGFHGAFPPTNSYPSFGLMSGPSAHTYTGFPLSISPSQPKSLPSQSVAHRALSTTHTAVGDLQDAVRTPESSQFLNTQSLNKSKRRRARNWDTWEVLLLVQGKKTEWERSEVSSGKDRFETSGEKWKRVERFLKEGKVVDRDAVACKNKWESLLSDYKAVKDWNRKPGNASYGALTAADKKAAYLPAVFPPSLLNLMDSFQGKAAHVSPPPMDSFHRSIEASRAASPSPGDGSGGEDSAEVAPSPAPHGRDHIPPSPVPHGRDHIHPSPVPHGRDHIPPSPVPHGGDHIPPSPVPHGDHIQASVGKKPVEVMSLFVAAFEKMASNMINIEKGRDERSERLLALENRKYELERNKFELQARKLDIERDDRKGLVRVLGNLAGAFHRMADKM